MIIYLLLELTVDIETNIKKNFDRKVKLYQQLLAELSNRYKINYVNLSLGAIGTIVNDSLVMTAMKKFNLEKSKTFKLLKSDTDFPFQSCKFFLFTNKIHVKFKKYYYHHYNYKYYYFVFIITITISVVIAITNVISTNIIIITIFGILLLPLLPVIS